MARSAVPKWYVVTGVPSSGISTLVTALAPYVDRTFPEVAREYIDQSLKKGIPVKKLRKSEASFQKTVLRKKIAREARLDRNRTSVFERGIPDSIAYFKIAGLDPEPVKRYSKSRYRMVFYLEPLEYERDYARTESPETRDMLNKLILEGYEEMGYKIVHVPAVAVEERVRIVRHFLEKPSHIAREE